MKHVILVLSIILYVCLIPLKLWSMMQDTEKCMLYISDIFLSTNNKSLTLWKGRK